MQMLKYFFLARNVEYQVWGVMYVFWQFRIGDNMKSIRAITTLIWCKNSFKFYRLILYLVTTLAITYIYLRRTF